MYSHWKFSWFTYTLTHSPLFLILSIHLHLSCSFSSIFPSAAAAAAKSLQLCPTLCDPIDGSPPGSPVPGLSRQEHWSGLPFPSPMHESEKLKWNRSVVSDSQWPHGVQPTRLLHPWDPPGKSTGVGCHCLLRIISLIPPISCNTLTQILRVCVCVCVCFDELFYWNGRFDIFSHSSPEVVYILRLFYTCVQT